ncbi:MAG: efflux RND transporter periplasmic adaptor subunit [Candidatus Sungbacteria bacterium]|nr:efflux RND transporter periplasmic adaptor subunit [Candidatus Sungbacteria bacterium]
MKKRIMRQLQDNAVLYTIIAVAIVGFGGYNLFFKSSGSKEQTLVVHPEEFLQQVSVSGKVVAAQDVDLGFSQSGRVTYVRGDVGARVAAGQLLAEIENSDIRANISQRQAVLASQEAKLDSLHAGTRAEDIAVAQSTVDGAVSALDQANQGIINAIADAYAKSDDAIHNKLDQFISNPRSMSPQLSFTTSASQLAIDIPAKRVMIEQMLTTWQSAILGLNMASDLPAAAAQAQTNLAAVAALLSDASAALARAVPTSSVSQTTINTYTSDIATARTTINTSITAINTALTTQKAAVSTLDSARKSLALKKAGSTPADIAAQAAQVAAAQADVENAQAQLAKTRIVAPFSGVITKMDAKVGQIVSPNTPEISIIGSGAFQVESFIPETNVALIKVGNSAIVTLDAYGESVPFEAKLVSIDPAETVRDGVSTYRAVLQFISQDPRIKSGMTAGVVITTQKKEGVLAVPQGIVIERDGAYFVPIKEGKGTVERQVTTGETSSLGHIEILSGLNEGDTVILSASE